MRGFYILALLIIASNALAATVNGNLVIGNKGTASFNSQGSFDINVAKGDAVRISNLNSIVISNPGSSGDRTASDNVCYYATTAQYTIDMDSQSSPTGNFKLVNTTNSNKTVPYELTWDDGKNGTADATFLRNSDTAQTINSNNRASASCQATGGTNATITVTVRNASYNSMSTGLYTDTVHITVKAK
jgi:hypothetical protein